jgi:glutamine amidotransferase
MTDELVIIGSSGANLASLGFALERLRTKAPVSEDPERVARAKRVILPGVGAADDAMVRLRARGLAELVPTLTQPVLGICLGMQLLFSASQEDDAECLGIIEADVQRIPDQADLPVPEIGWNELEDIRDCPLLKGIEPGSYAYFVHSYIAPIGPYTRAVADYGGPFSAVVQQQNFFGTQFHPERSSGVGARVLENFLQL